MGEVHRRGRVRPGAAPRLPQPHLGGPDRRRGLPAGGDVRLPRRRAGGTWATAHAVAPAHTQSFPAKPNWYPRSAPGADADSAGFVAPTAHPELYDAEESATGPAGTVVAFQPSTFHRGTALSAPRGVRYSMHVNYRPSVAEWAQRHSWVSHSHDPDWYRFVERATPRQLALFGFPPPGHPYWTTDTLAGVAQRYRNLDLTPWQTTP